MERAGDTCSLLVPGGLAGAAPLWAALGPWAGLPGRRG